MKKPDFEFLGLRRNALVFMTTSLFLGMGNQISRAFLDLYAREYLGAPILVLGLFGTIQGLLRLILVVPIGYWSDIIGHHRKWLMVAGDAISTVAFFIYAIAGNWVWLIPGIFLETGYNITIPVGNAIIFDSINPEKRGLAMATRSLTTMLPSTFVPILAGLYLDSVGMAAGMPLLFIIGGLFRVVGTLGRALFIKEQKMDFNAKALTSSDTRVTGGKITKMVSEMLGPVISTKMLQIMVVISAIGAIGISVTSRLQAIYATEVIGLNTAEWGLVVGMAQTVGAILRIPLGKLADIFGRRKCILIDYIVRPVYFLGFAYSQSFWQVFLVNTLHDLSGEAGAPAWQAMIIDITPRGSRGRVNGVFSMVSALTATIFPSLGAFLWVTYGPIWAYVMCSAGEALGVLLIYFFLKEPEHREK
ncbi:MAG: MFS transporter [Candidatus Bathyarchaeota archaeon]